MLRSGESHRSGSCAKKRETHHSLQKQHHRSMWWLRRGGRHHILCLPKPSGVCGGSHRPRLCSIAAQGQCAIGSEESDFIMWMRKRKEDEACSVVTIGTSLYGRALVAMRPIHAGECILRISKNLIITPCKLHEEVKRFLHKDVSNCARLALFLLSEQHSGQASEWAPYIGSLPQPGTLHNTVLWNDEELEMLRQSSSVHHQSLQCRASISKEYAAVQHVFRKCPHLFGSNVTPSIFQHAYAVVNSRAWGVDEQNTVGLVPYVDFFNHDATSRSFLSFDDDYEHAEVIADRDYAPGEQVFINYGKFGNDVLAVTFGFTLDYNPYDQVEVWMGLSQRDILWKAKSWLLHSYGMPTLCGVQDFNGGGNAFLIKEVKLSKGRGKGISQSLRAFARILCADSREELADMAKEATELDGRLARRPLKNRHKELQAMVLLLARVESLVQDYIAALLAHEVTDFCRIKQKPTSAMRRGMAVAVLRGELRVLQSAATWLKYHCIELNSLL